MGGVLILVFMGRWNKIGKADDLCFEMCLCLFSIGCLLKLSVLCSRVQKP